MRNRLTLSVFKKIVILLLICAPLAGYSQQYWQLGGFLGISNYSGDLAEKRVDFGYTRYALGIFAKRDFNRYFSLRAGLNYGRIAGADSTNKDPSLVDRNLSFRSPIFELNLIGEFNFLDIDERGFTPYVFGGAAVFSFYPTTRDANGNVVKLRALTTEGQGLAQYPTRQKYNLRSLSIPFGAGVKVLIKENWILGFEVGLRRTFSDYLDDVSLGYADRNTLLLGRGQRAVDFAYRGPGTYPPEGFARGSDKYDDWYIFSGLTLSYRFGGGGKGPWGHWKKQKFSDCPRM
ncbi:DUF6089 family protein [Chitinophaga sp. CF118]|uniref:type IX secretion system protein PorG n=1 Tax=Chitinophaga sp. CF118 TaxID=1884367 RepID=UPI0015A5B358|nr:DUF6089 family protein [Chitinophaga sp. CF118]